MDFNESNNESSNETEFEKLFGEEFFIIDSDNMDSINEKLYGFVVGKHEIIYNETKLDNENLTGDGVYLYLKVTEKEIAIYQDSRGSYGLYVYEDRNYFAISNSFLKLVEFLKTKRHLTFNMEYAKSYIVTPLCSHIYKETLVNEITFLPRNCIVHIDKSKNSVEYENLDFRENTIEIDSIEGLEILDDWFYRWIDVVRFIKKNTNNLIFDLSGGFDSRLSLIFALCSNIDLEKIRINSLQSKHGRFDEDYEIATEISKNYPLPLNKEVVSVEKIPFKDMNTSLLLSSYNRLGFSNQIPHYFYKNKDPVYLISGGYGETLREWHRVYPNEFIENFEKRCEQFDVSFIEDVKHIINSSFEQLKNDFNIENENSKELVDLMFSEGRFRNHFGKLTSLRYLINRFNITPLADTNLRKLKRKTKSCNDDNLLMAVIFTRYCPDLLNFRFDSNKRIDEKTIEQAKEINKIKQFVSKKLDFISGPDLNNEAIKKNKFKYTFGGKTIDDYLRNIYHSRLFEMEFKKYFTTQLYDKISYNITHQTYFPLQDSVAIFSALKIINDIGYNPIREENNLKEWLNVFNEFDLDNDDSINPKDMRLLLNHITCRMDLINEGSENNSVELINSSDSRIYSLYPNWLKNPDWLKNDAGQGMMLTSAKTPLNLSVKCIGDGELNIILRSKDVRDKNKNRYPIYIDYNKLIVDDMELFEGHNVISHDLPFHFKKSVKNMEIINIQVEWSPFNNSCEYKNENAIEYENESANENVGILQKFKHFLKQ